MMTRGAIPIRRAEPPVEPPVVWAGAECAFLRVNGEERDQLRATGHAGRGADLRRLAAMGVRGVRQPLLWGWTASTGSPRRRSQATRRWADRQLSALDSLGMQPVVA